MLKELKPLSSLPFLFVLSLLLLNDLYFKGLFHNTFTGKLSDFCGLFIFPIFWSVLFPRKKLFIFFLTALFFTYWKSAYSEPFIDLFSEYIFPVQRVVDMTDLVAFAILPFAWYFLSAPPQKTSYLNPGIAALLTIFSFCATSQAKPHQRFEQPQYVLFKASGFTSDISLYEDDFKIHRLDELIAVEVKEINIDNSPVKKDDFQKTLIQKELDKRVLKELNIDEKGYLNDSAKPIGNNTLIINTNRYKDSVNFKGSRLHGKFIRTATDDGKILIEGQYRNGLEDSMWTFRDSITDDITEKTFLNGEMIKVKYFDFNQSLVSKKFNTRMETIRNKYFHIAILVILAVWVFVLIVKNYKSVYPEKILFSTTEKVSFSFILPIVVTIWSIIISELLPDSFSYPFGFFSDLFLIYLFTIPVFIILFFMIKIRKKIDILWYSLSFALLFNLYKEVIYLNKLTAELSVPFF